LIEFREVWLEFGGGLGRGMSGSDRDLDEVEAKFEYGTWVFGLGRGQGSWILSFCPY